MIIEKNSTTKNLISFIMSTLQFSYEASESYTYCNIPCWSQSQLSFCSLDRNLEMFKMNIRYPYFVDLEEWKEARFILEAFRQIRKGRR